MNFLNTFIIILSTSNKIILAIQNRCILLFVFNNSKTMYIRKTFFWIQSYNNKSFLINQLDLFLIF